MVLSWNDPDRVVALVEALAELDPAPGRVVIVDNGSAPEVPARLAAAFPEHDLLRLPDNRGFAAAANRGIARALACGAAWTWLLNTDIELPVDALGKLLAAAADDPRCGMAGAVLVEADGSVQARGGGRVCLATGIARHVVSATERCDYLSGACLLLRSAMLQQIGTFDERFFFSWEDIELGYRAREAGWGLAVAGDCTIVHHEGSSLGRWSEARWYHLFRGMMTFLAMRSPRPRRAAWMRFAHHVATMLGHGRRDAVRGAWRALAAGFGT